VSDAVTVESVSPTRYALRSRSGRLLLVLDGDDAHDVAEAVAQLAGPTWAPESVASQEAA
jgi:hypothetical protein